MWYYTYRQRELYERAGWFSFVLSKVVQYSSPPPSYKVFLHCTTKLGDGENYSTLGDVDEMECECASSEQPVQLARETETNRRNGEAAENRTVGVATRT